MAKTKETKNTSSTRKTTTSTKKPAAKGTVTCKKCGKTMNKGVKFCPSCGAAMTSTSRAAKSPSSRTAKTPAKSTASAKQIQEYKTFGGWLLAIYWTEIIGGILTLVLMVVPVLSALAASSMYLGRYVTRYVYGSGWMISTVISIAITCVATVCYIRSAIQMKARNPRFFDIFVFGALITLAGSIVSSLSSIGGFYWVGGFIFTIILGAISFAVGVAIAIMYFQKSVRVKVYFGGRPLHDSRFWNIIKSLPDFIISEKPLW